MFRVLTVVDKENSAIDRLAKGVIPYHSNLDYKVLAVHPKRPDPQQLAEFEKYAKTADVIDYQYFRTAEMLRARYAWLKDVPSILTHHNPYSINESDWNDYQAVIGINKSITEDLKNITQARVEYIHHASDPYFWQYNEDYKYRRSVIMVANRIESKKGILPVAQACKELGITLNLVGAISDNDYFLEVMKTGAVEFAQQITDEQLRDLYYRAGLHICNSVDGFESGTLPILEAMQCGVPVITRKIGHIPDIKGEENLVINHHPPDSVDTLVELISRTLADRKLLDTLRREGWLSIKHMNYERRAFMYQKLYRELLPEKPVSVIMPVADKPEVTSKTIQAVLEQDYPNIELIVIDDGQDKQAETISKLQKICQIPLRYLTLPEKGYNLAKARNLASIEATGELLVFCDQRMQMDKDCVSQFINKHKPKLWLYGNKGAKKDFVENLSCISKEDFVTFGMFNERCDKYGALSQETRTRFRRQGGNTLFVEEAKATPLGVSRNKSRKRFEIMESKNWLWKVGLQ